MERREDCKRGEGEENGGKGGRKTWRLEKASVSEANMRARIQIKIQRH